MFSQRKMSCQWNSVLYYHNSPNLYEKEGKRLECMLELHQNLVWSRLRKLMALSQSSFFLVFLEKSDSAITWNVAIIIVRVKVVDCNFSIQIWIGCLPKFIPQNQNLPLYLMLLIIGGGPLLFSFPSPYLYTTPCLTMRYHPGTDNLKLSMFLCLLLFVCFNNLHLPHVCLFVVCFLL